MRIRRQAMPRQLILDFHNLPLRRLKEEKIIGSRHCKLVASVVVVVVMICRVFDNLSICKIKRLSMWASNRVAIFGIEIAKLPLKISSLLKAILQGNLIFLPKISLGKQKMVTWGRKRSRRAPIWRSQILFTKVRTPFCSRWPQIIIIISTTHLRKVL